MGKWLTENPMTFLMFVLTFIVAIVGGILVLTDNAGTLSFEDYLNDLTKFALAIAALGGAKAIKNGMLGKPANIAVGQADTVQADNVVGDKAPTLSKDPFDDTSGEADDERAGWDTLSAVAAGEEFPEAAMLGGHPDGDAYDGPRAMPPGLQPGV
jgi:hypothetical protein